MDEPCSALDPIATADRGPDADLKREYTIVIVTHNMQQAARVSDYDRLLAGRGEERTSDELVEFDETRKLFTVPADKRTEDYITGRFG